jgi:hypothetical protein
MLASIKYVFLLYSAFSFKNYFHGCYSTLYSTTIITQHLCSHVFYFTSIIISKTTINASLKHDS